MPSIEQSVSTAPITGLSHVQLQVSDIEASACWYGAVLGAVPFAEDRAIGYVALRHPQSRIVVVLTKRPPARNGGGEAADQLVDHVAFAVPNGDSLAAWAEHLIGVGIEHPGVVRENGHPSLQLRDPDGLAVELVAP